LVSIKLLLAVDEVAYLIFHPPKVI
jgi:hypothetical protein